MIAPTEKTAARVKAPLPEQPVDVAIVGAGLGGLTAGAYLARAGLRVACFDHHYVAGGCATMFERGRTSERYCFDVGLHYVGDCGKGGMVPSLLGGVGVALAWNDLDPDGFDTLVFPDLRFRIPVGRDRYRERLVDTFPSEKRGIDRYVAFLSQVDRLQRRMDAAGGKMGWRTLIEALLHGRAVAKWQGATIGEVVQACTRDPQLQAVLLGQNGDYGVPPSEASALLHAGLQNHYFRGAHYPKGGGQVIADRLADVIEAHGGTVHLRCGIERVLVEGGRAVGVKVEGGSRHAGAEVRARAVLSNADLKRTLLDLVGPEHLPAGAVERTRGLQMAGALYLLCLGVKRDLAAQGMGATNYWQFDGYDMEAFYREARVADRPVPRGCYVTSTSFKDPHTPGHAPPGVTSVEVMTVVPHDLAAWGVTAADVARDRYRKTPAYLERKVAVEADLLRRLDALFPGAAADVVFRESASPLTHQRYTRATDGTGYGLAATPAQMMRGRPGYQGPLPGLWLCGASTRAGHGVVGAMTGGQRAARRIGLALGVAVADPAA
jgi:phytoene dehydrogenase-like protein